jgi:hypothetical protein
VLWLPFKITDAKTTADLRGTQGRDREPFEEG